MIQVLLIMILVWLWILSLQTWAEGPRGRTGPSPEQQCGPDAHWDAAVGRCRRNVPLTIPPPKLLPPPPGVIVLWPGGVKEQADSCPDGFNEVTELGGWRFCVDPEHPEPIPPLMAPPISGIPFEEARAILKRHREELMRFPGVVGVGLGADGIYVQTNNPKVLPQEVEGLPVKAIPPLGPGKGLNHSLNTRIRPLRGGVAIRDNNWTPSVTLTGVGLSQGRPWLIFPTHVMQDCENDSPCLLPSQGGPSELNNCSPYAGTQRIVHPPSTSPEIVGFVQRWDPLRPGHDSTDAAAAFMDTDTIEGNGSLHADRKLEEWGTFTGVDTSPAAQTTVTVVSSLDPHIFSSNR